MKKTKEPKEFHRPVSPFMKGLQKTRAEKAAVADSLFFSSVPANIKQPGAEIDRFEELKRKGWENLHKQEREEYRNLMAEKQKDSDSVTVDIDIDQ
jgi:hypothetical protein